MARRKRPETLAITQMVAAFGEFDSDAAKRAIVIVVRRVVDQRIELAGVVYHTIERRRQIVGVFYQKAPGFVGYQSQIPAQVRPHRLGPLKPVYSAVLRVLVP